MHFVGMSAVSFYNSNGKKIYNSYLIKDNVHSLSLRIIFDPFNFFIIHLIIFNLNIFKGEIIEISYRIDYTIASLVVVIVLVYIGIQICSKDIAFRMDRIDTIEEFVR